LSCGEGLRFLEGEVGIDARLAGAANRHAPKQACPGE
jgi:hypothetical protein